MLGSGSSQFYQVAGPKRIYALRLARAHASCLFGWIKFRPGQMGSTGLPEHFFKDVAIFFHYTAEQAVPVTGVTGDTLAVCAPLRACRAALRPIVG